MRVPYLFAVLMILQYGYAFADSKDDCFTMIKSAGFAPEDPYSFERGGLFSYDQHLFGVFTCSVDSSGGVVEVRRGKTLIAQDGFIGIEALEARESVAESAQGLLSLAEDERDLAIKAARDAFDQRTRLIESNRHTALEAIKKGAYSEDALSFFSVKGKPSISSVRRGNEDAGAQQNRDDSAGTSTARSNDSESSALVEKVDNDNMALELAETFGSVVELINKNQFASAYRAAEPALKAGAYSDDQIEELEALAYGKVRAVPASNVSRNVEGYKLLGVLDPSEQRYKTSLRKYQDIERERREKVESASLVERFNWIATRLNSSSTEAQREIAFNTVKGKRVHASGRISDVERRGFINPPLISLDTDYSNLDIACYLPYDTPESKLASLKIGQRFVCDGSADRYIFLLGGALVTVTSEY